MKLQFIELLKQLKIDDNKLKLLPVKVLKLDEKKTCGKTKKIVHKYLIWGGTKYMNELQWKLVFPSIAK